MLAGRREQGLELALLQRDVYELPAPCLLAREQRERDAERGFRRRVIVGGRHAAAHRRTIRIPRERGVPAHRHRDQVVAPVARVGTGLAERRNRTVHELRVRLPKRLITETARSQLPGSEGLEYHIGRLDQRAVELASALRREVQRDAAFARVEREPEQASLRVRDAAQKGAPASGRVAAGWLALAHVGAHVSQDLAGQNAARIGQVDDAHALKRAGHSTPPRPRTRAGRLPRSLPDAC